MLLDYNPQEELEFPLYSMKLKTLHKGGAKLLLIEGLVQSSVAVRKQRYT